MVTDVDFHLQYDPEIKLIYVLPNNEINLDELIKDFQIPIFIQIIHK